VVPDYAAPLTGAADSVTGVFAGSEPSVGMASPSCNCPSAHETVSSVIGFGSRGQLEEWIKSRINDENVGNLNHIQTDLGKLKSGLESWTQQHIDMKLAGLHDKMKEENEAKYEEMVDTVAASIAQARASTIAAAAVTDTSDDATRYSELVCKRSSVM
jgi:hypothetical protein